MVPRVGANDGEQGHVSPTHAQWVTVAATSYISSSEVSRNWAGVGVGAI